MKVMTIVGTRPEIIKLSRVIAELERHVRHVLVHTGQNFDYELNEIFFEQLELRKPDHFLEAAGKTAAETIGNVIARADRIMARERPDALLLLGDTNSCLAAIPAKRRKIPIFHMEAGNRCFDERVPEEVNRRIVDHVSDINLPYTEHARRYLLREGIRPETVIKTGSPMREVLTYYEARIEASRVLERLELEPQGYFLVSAHREENIDNAENLADLLASLGAIAKRYGRRVIVSTHPRTRNKLAALDRKALPAKVEFLKPLGFIDYVKLQTNARCVLSDSGTLTEESALLAFPAVMIRQAHERPEGMDEGTLIMSGLKAGQVLAAIDATTAHCAQHERPFRTPSDYESDNVSLKVVRIILSYTDYVNRTVWFK
ncbi:MAG: UDP-N-acetylglucosamine 2-epimerase [Betaproteobacteria bacterium RIFCSPLOWO2_12_FULL_62_13]|nr:MAG: UDP-N-acetylglucosamine 2-epimerase [Betaproteobacteria bacterium RIFCSPLOWO2_12_FULL_62_13]